MVGEGQGGIRTIEEPSGRRLELLFHATYKGPFVKLGLGGASDLKQAWMCMAWVRQQGYRGGESRRGVLGGHCSSLGDGRQWLALWGERRPWGIVDCRGGDWDVKTGSCGQRRKSGGCPELLLRPGKMREQEENLTLKRSGVPNPAAFEMSRTGSMLCLWDKH